RRDRAAQVLAGEVGAALDRLLELARELERPADPAVAAVLAAHVAMDEALADDAHGLAQRVATGRAASATCAVIHSRGSKIPCGTMRPRCRSGLPAASTAPTAETPNRRRRSKFERRKSERSGMYS